MSYGFDDEKIRTQAGIGQSYGDVGSSCGVDRVRGSPRTVAIELVTPGRSGGMEPSDIASPVVGENGGAGNQQNVEIEGGNGEDGKRGERPCGTDPDNANPPGVANDGENSRSGLFPVGSRSQDDRCEGASVFQLNLRVVSAF